MTDTTDTPTVTVTLSGEFAACDRFADWLDVNLSQWDDRDTLRVHVRTTPARAPLGDPPGFADRAARLLDGWAPGDDVDRDAEVADVLRQAVGLDDDPDAAPVLADDRLERGVLDVLRRADFLRRGYMADGSDPFGGPPAPELRPARPRVVISGLADAVQAVYAANGERVSADTRRTLADAVEALAWISRQADAALPASLDRAEFPATA